MDAALAFFASARAAVRGTHRRPGLAAQRLTHGQQPPDAHRHGHHSRWSAVRGGAAAAAPSHRVRARSRGADGRVGMVRVPSHPELLARALCRGRGCIAADVMAFPLRCRSIAISFFMSVVAWWFVALCGSSSPRRASRWSASLAGVIALVPAWVALARMRADLPRGAEWILFAFVLVWMADIGGYFFGRRLGRTMLAPNVSPGKTWEGVLGGFVLSAAVAIAGSLWFGLGPGSLPGAVPRGGRILRGR